MKTKPTTTAATTTANERIVDQTMELLGLLEHAKCIVAGLEHSITTKGRFTPEDIEMLQSAAASCQIAHEDFWHLADTDLPSTH